MLRPRRSPNPCTPDEANISTVIWSDGASSARDCDLQKPQRKVALGETWSGLGDISPLCLVEHHLLRGGVFQHYVMGGLASWAPCWLPCLFDTLLANCRSGCDAGTSGGFSSRRPILKRGYSRTSYACVLRRRAKESSKGLQALPPDLLLYAEAARIAFCEARSALRNALTIHEVSS